MTLKGQAGRNVVFTCDVVQKLQLRLLHTNCHIPVTEARWLPQIGFLFAVEGLEQPQPQTSRVSETDVVHSSLNCPIFNPGKNAKNQHRNGNAVDQNYCAKKTLIILSD